LSDDYDGPALRRIAAGRVKQDVANMRRAVGVNENRVLTDISAFICVSPHGNLIRSTIRPDADESWRVLRESITEPDTLIDKGWTVRRMSCAVGEVVS
jgi:hypothetical protein